MKRVFKPAAIALSGAIAVCMATLVAPCGAAEDQTWELKTADTSLTVGRKGNTVYLCALANPAKNHNWLPVPVAQPWVEKAQVQGARTPEKLDWTYKDAAVDTSNGTKVTLRFRNAKPSLELVSEWWARPGRGPVRTATTIKNLSGKPLSLSYQPSVRLAATADGPVTVWYIPTSAVKKIDPVGVYRDKLSDNYGKNLATTMRDGGWIPFAALESSGGHGIYVGTEWSLALTRVAGRSDRIATLTAGVLVPGSGKGKDVLWEEEKFGYGLNDGEVFVVPPALIGAYVGDMDDAGNSLKKYLWDYSMPQILRTDATYPKVQWNGWNALGNGEPLESRYRPWLDEVAALGYEEVMIDTGWWGERYPPKSHPQRWPGGMKAAADYAHGKGLRFGLYLDKTADYDSIKYLYDTYGADLYRSDYIHIPSVQTFYDTLDRLQKDIPNFQYENCNEGGKIKDFGVMKRAVKIFVTDTYSELDIQRAWHDASYVFPPIQIMGNVAGRLRGVTGAVYSFRTSAQGAPEWFVHSPATWTPAEKDAVKAAVTLYKTKVRPLQRDSNLYHLTPRPDNVIWYAFQYYKPEQKKGVVYVFKPKSDADTQVIKLKGLDPAAPYAVTFADGSNPPVTRTGAVLMNTGLQVALKGQFVSEWIFLN
jgi:hypothetical protein